MLLLATHAFASPRRAGFELASVVDQLAQPALGQAEIPREPHGRAGLAANDADLHFEARRQAPAARQGAPSLLEFLRIGRAELADVAPWDVARLRVHRVLYLIHVIIAIDARPRPDDHDLAAGHGS